MLARVVEQYADLPRFLRKPMWRVWHSLIIRQERRQVDTTLMNYGYVGLDPDAPPLALAPEDEAQRYCIHLYHQVAAQLNLRGLDVLEVGSGRGGGASYIARYLEPKSVTGIDLAPDVIAFCNQHHRAVHNLKFVVGDAEAIPFPDGWFDAVVNVESSRCYPDVPRFLAEVRRVLRPNGALLLTDMRWAKDAATLRSQLVAAGFALEREVEITAQVTRALELDDARRKGLIRSKVPGWLVPAFDEFAGVQGSGRYGSFADRSMQYWTYLARRADG